MKDLESKSTPAPEMVSTEASKQPLPAASSDDNHNEQPSSATTSTKVLGRRLRRMKRRLFLDAVAGADSPVATKPATATFMNRDDDAWQWTRTKPSTSSRSAAIKPQFVKRDSLLLAAESTTTLDSGSGSFAEDQAE